MKAEFIERTPQQCAAHIAEEAVLNFAVGTEYECDQGYWIRLKAHKAPPKKSVDYPEWDRQFVELVKPEVERLLIEAFSAHDLSFEIFWDRFQVFYPERVRPDDNVPIPQNGFKFVIPDLEIYSQFKHYSYRDSGWYNTASTSLCLLIYE